MLRQILPSLSHPPGSRSSAAHMNHHSAYGDRLSIAANGDKGREEDGRTEVLLEAGEGGS